MPLSEINTLYNIKIFIVFFRKQKRERNKELVTTFTFDVLLSRYEASEIYDILYFCHHLILFAFLLL